MKLTSLVLFVIGLFAGAIPSQAQVLFSTNFDSSRYTLGNISGQDGWFMNSSSNASKVQVETTTVNSGSQAVSVIAPTTPGVAMPLHTITISALGVIDATIFMRIESAGSSWAPLCFYYSGGNGTSAPLCLSLTPDGLAYLVSISVRSPDGASVPVGVWNNFRLHLDFGAHTMTGYVNGNATGTIALPAQIPSGSWVVGFGFIGAAIGGANSTVAYFDDLSVFVGGVPYYFSHLAFGGGFQTTLTYVNYSPQAITCVTNFFSDSGQPLSTPFSTGDIPARTDVLQPGGSIHDQTVASLTAAVTAGWAQAVCTGAVQAGLLYRYYVSGAPVGEASVSAESAPTTEFATFAQAAANSTGIAYANPSTTQPATITITAYNASGAMLGSQIVTLGPLQHGAANVGPLLGLSSFTGFVKITSTIPVLSLSLNAEAFPVFSSLPPGDLPSSTALVTP